MTDRQLHLVRHGEVFNPDRVLYGRLPGYELSPLGHQMAEAAAAELGRAGRPVGALYASPLERAQQSAAPIAEAFGRTVEVEPRIIEPSNDFEGQVKSGAGSAMLNPRFWYRYRNPLRPSWGEPYRDMAARMNAAMNEAWAAEPDGDIVMVSHQAVIWVSHLAVAGKRLFHNPAARRCELSSITSFTLRDGVWREVDYRSPAQPLLGQSIDVGAV